MIDGVFACAEFLQESRVMGTYYLEKCKKANTFVLKKFF